MRPTIDWVKRKVEEWIERGFDGALPMPKVQLTRARCYCGQLAYTRHVAVNGEFYTDFKIRISSLFDHDSATIEDTIIHELIHYEILYNRRRDTSPHGELFKHRMNELNFRFGRHISVSQKLTPEQIDSDKRKFHHLLCLVRFANGTYGVTRVARTRIFDVWDEIHLIPDVKDFIWVWSDHPYFNRFPRIRRAAAYKVTPEELRSNLDEACILHKEGFVIKLGGRFDINAWIDDKEKIEAQNCQ